MAAAYREAGEQQIRQSEALVKREAEGRRD
jgi:hypothetical protein